MTTQKESHEQLFQLFDDAWEASLEADPIGATFIGEARYNDRLPDSSEGAQADRLAELRRFGKRLESIETESLSEEDQLNYDLFEQSLENEIGQIEFRVYRMPISKTDGIHSFFPDLVNFYTPLLTKKDYENLIARMRAFPKYIEENISVMKAGLDDGHMPPNVTLDGVEQQISSNIVEEAEKSRLNKPFENFPNSITKTEKEKLKKSGQDVIMNEVVPSYSTLLEFFQEEYIPGAREDIAAANLPNGREYYQHRIKYYTSLDLTAEEIHEIGMGEVSRIRKEMDESIKNTGFKGDFKEFVEFLRTDEQFYAESSEALLRQAAYICKRMDGKLPGLFATLPRMPYGIEPMPDETAPDDTTARYAPPSGDGTRAGIYWLNTYDLKSRPLYELEALSLHEAVPGHHLQLAIQFELGELPNFRRFGFFTSYIEGWGLYAERLGLEVGFYQDPYSDFGRLSYEMWRACRLVVDTGMHALDWPRQKAIDFMSENTSLTLLNIQNEIDRYIGWPGQALAYKMGELKIRELRARAEEQLKNKFDVRLFHDELLKRGPLPLNILENMIDDWIEQILAK